MTSTSETDVHLRETLAPPRIKPVPNTSKIPVPFAYSSSDDGTNENLLLVLHGLGDTHVPFSRMAKSLKLPQTATLVLRAPEQVPFLYEDAYQWYPSFDGLGQPLQRANPTPALDLLSKVFLHLTSSSTDGGLGWSARKIHLFGFGQGGSVAAEFGIKWWKEQLAAVAGAGAVPTSIGSIITVSGPLLSFPTLSKPCPTPLLVVHRPRSEDFSLTNSNMTEFKKGYQNVKEERLAGTDGGMPASKVEWEPIMRFWSGELERRQVDGLYEVMSGIAPFTIIERAEYLESTSGERLD